MGVWKLWSQKPFHHTAWTRSPGTILTMWRKTRLSWSETFFQIHISSGGGSDLKIPPPAFGFLQTFQVSRLHAGVPLTFLTRPKLKRRRRRASLQSFFATCSSCSILKWRPPTFQAKHVLSTFGLRWGGNPTKFLSHIYFGRWLHLQTCFVQRAKEEIWNGSSWRI